MRRLLFICAALLVMPAKTARPQEKPAAPKSLVPNFVLVIHGGAGVIPKEDLTPDKEKAARATMDATLLAGHDVLVRGAFLLQAGGVLLAGYGAADEKLERGDRKSTRLNSSHSQQSRMPSSA